MIWPPHSQSIAVKKFNRNAHPRTPAEMIHAQLPSQAMQAHVTVITGLPAPPLIYSEARGHRIFGGCVRDSGGHLFTAARKEANSTAVNPGGEPLYGVEKTPPVCRGRRGCVMARRGAGPGTRPPSSWTQPCSAGSSTQASSQQEAHKQ